MSTKPLPPFQRNYSTSQIEISSKLRNSANNLGKLIRETSQKEHIKDKAYEDTAKRLLQNADNNINFYDIPQFDGLKKKNGRKNYKSIYVLSELQQLRGTEFFQNVKKKLDGMDVNKNALLNAQDVNKIKDSISWQQEHSKLEQQIRDDMKKKGKIYLLNEIYNKFDEDIAGQTVVSKAKQSFLKREQQEKKRNLMNHLDDFKKQIKSQKEKLQQQQAQQEVRQKIDRTAFRKQTRRQSLMNVINNQVHGLGSNESDDNSRQQSSKKKLSQFLNGSSKNQKMQDDLEYNIERENFINSFNSAIDKKKQRNHIDISKDQDRTTLKKIDKYIKGAVNVDGVTDEKQREEELDFDLTPEGIQLNLQVIYSDESIESYQSYYQKAIAYEKKSQIFEQNLNNIISNSEAYIGQKQNTIRIIRQETHNILQKLTDIANYIDQLAEEKKEMKTVSLEKSVSGLTIPDVNESLMRQSKNMNISKASMQRQNMIDQLMMKEKRLQEIDDQIQILKENRDKFREKVEYNDGIITELEKQIHDKKTEFKNHQKTQIILYKQLLLIGKDVREKGLCWILRKLKGFEQQITKIDLPKFLDDKGKEYLMIRAKQEQNLDELKDLQEFNLDIYKNNLKFQSLQQNQDLNLTQIENVLDYTQQEHSQINMEQNNEVFNANSLSINQNLSQIGGHFTQGSILNNSSMILGNQNSMNLSQVDVPEIKQQEMEKNKSNDFKFSKRLLNGMDVNNQEVTRNIINEYYKSKQTSSDMVYDQTKQKISQSVKQWIDHGISNQNINQSQSYINNSIINNQNNMSDNNQIRIQNNGFESGFPDQSMIGPSFSFQIDLYENEQHINDNQTKDQYIDYYRKKSVEIKSLKQKIKKMEVAEIERIIKEFDYQNYGQKYNIDCGTVLASLFGGEKSDKYILRYGMQKK